MFIPLVLVAALTGPSLAATQRDPSSPTRRIENARVTQVSPPAPDSGIFAVYRDFDVLLPDGQAHRMYVLWLSQNQYMPEIGVTCTIAYRREALLPGNLHRPQREGRPDEGAFNVVHELNCGPPLELPRAGQRSPSAL